MLARIVVVAPRAAGEVLDVVVLSKELGALVENEVEIAQQVGSQRVAVFALLAANGRVRLAATGGVIVHFAQTRVDRIRAYLVHEAVPRVGNRLVAQL